MYIYWTDAEAPFVIRRHLAAFGRFRSSRNGGRFEDVRRVSTIHLGEEQREADWRHPQFVRTGVDAPSSRFRSSGGHEGVLSFLPHLQELAHEQCVPLIGEIL